MGGVYTENLLKGTKDFSGEWRRRETYSEAPEKYNGFTVLTKKNDWEGVTQDVELKAGEWYTFSCFAKSDIDNCESSIFISDNSGEVKNPGSFSNDSFKLNISTDWKMHYVKTLCLRSGYASFRIETYKYENIFVCGYKLEHGINDYPFWTPNPTDVYAE